MLRQEDFDLQNQYVLYLEDIYHTGHSGEMGTRKIGQEYDERRKGNNRH